MSYHLETYPANEVTLVPLFSIQFDSKDDAIRHATQMAAGVFAVQGGRHVRRGDTWTVGIGAGMQNIIVKEG